MARSTTDTDACPTDARPTFSLVFLTWNAGEAILRTLNSVKRQSVTDHEVVVVDNDSRDDTVAMVREAYPDDDSIRVLENDDNRGFSRGIERGIRESRGQYVCCYNHDTVFPEGYLETLAEHVGPDAVWTTARRNHRVSTDRASVRLLSKYRFTVPYLVDSLSGIADVNYVPGDGLIVPREIIREELGGRVFDPSVPMRGEDVDLSLRLAELGVPMRAVLDTHSVHPDNEDRYAPTVENLRVLAGTVHARIVAHRNNDAPASTLALAAGSILTNPAVVYCTPYPRSEAAFSEAVSVRESVDRVDPLGNVPS